MTPGPGSLPAWPSSPRMTAPGSSDHDTACERDHGAESPSLHQAPGPVPR